MHHLHTASPIQQHFLKSSKLHLGQELFTCTRILLASKQNPDSFISLLLDCHDASKVSEKYFKVSIYVLTAKTIH